MADYLGLMNGVWRTARKCGTRNTVPTFAGMLADPFGAVVIPHFEDRVDNDDLSQALSFTQLDLLRRAMPGWIATCVIVGTFGMMRRSELLGLNRGCSACR